MRSQSAITAAEIDSIESAVLQTMNFNNEMEESHAGLQCSNKCTEEGDRGENSQGKLEDGN